MILEPVFFETPCINAFISWKLYTGVPKPGVFLVLTPLTFLTLHPHFLDLKNFSIFHGQSSGVRKSETVTLFNYFISQISVVAKVGGGNFHPVIISQMHVFTCSKIKNCGQYLMNAEHSKLMLKTSCITRFVLDG